MMNNGYGYDQQYRSDQRPPPSARPQYPPQGRSFDQRPPPRRPPPQQQVRQQQWQQPPPPHQQQQQQQYQQHQHQQPQQQQYRQQYQQPPPQRQRPPPREYEQYDQYNAHDAYSNQQQYANHNDGYYEDHYQYEQNYDHYGGGQDDSQYRERQYQYDERYRSDARQPAPEQYPQGYEQYPQPQQGYHGKPPRNERPPPPQVRERILQNQPESPQTKAWDNPFGAFPSKKPQEGGKGRSSMEEGNKVKSPQQRVSDQRPATSHGNQRPFSPPQHPQQANSGGPGMPTRLESRQDVPRRKEVPAEGFDRPSYGDDRTQRPLQRAMTAPMPDPYAGHQDHRPNSADGFGAVQPQYQGQNSHHEYGRPATSQRSSRERPPVQPNSQTSSYRSTERPEHNGQAHAPSQGSQPVSNHGYTDDYRQPPKQELPLSPSREQAPELPNFDAMNMNTNEDQLTSQVPVRPAQPYRKPTYQAAQSQDALISPLAQFSFDLPATTPAADDRQPSTIPDYTRDQVNNHSMQKLNPPQSPTYPPTGQYPPRTASRGNMRSPPRNQHDDPPMPQSNYRQSDEGRRSDNYNQSNQYNHDHQQGYGSMQDSASQRSQPFRDAPSRAGYDPRLHTSNNGTPISQHHQDAPMRPPTSSSAPMSAQNHNRRPSADSYQPSIRSQTDISARPVPFRPGLMQSTPQPSPPPANDQQSMPPPPPPPPPPPSSQPPRNTSVPAKDSDDKAPVTIQELNNLRESYQNRPTDHALGLRFAKRLVQAAKNLPKQDGYVDPKETAKKRERYILDAHKIVKKLISTGYTEAMFYMADCYGQGLLGLQVDPKEAFSLYQSAAKLGHAQAAYRVAVCCELGPEEGGGTRRDPLKAMQWYKRAAALGDTPAMFKLGMILLKGMMGQPKSTRDGISWLKRAAERADAENPHALHELGLLYEKALPTDVVLRDEPYALQLFTQAAELGYKHSQFRLGSAYEYGLLGCPIDARMSIAWYTQAAAQGEHLSEFALSGWYLTGGGQAQPNQQPLLEQSDTEAYLWARKAAASGLAKAEFAMGYYTETGIGVASNVEEAKKWYFRAAAQNHPKARQRLEELRRGGARMQKARVSRSNVGKHNEGECSVM